MLRRPLTALILGSCYVCAWAQPQFTVQEIQFQGAGFAVRGLSDSGHVVGVKDFAQHNTQGVRWHNGQGEWLFGYPPGGIGQGVNAMAVNSSGIAAGHASNEPQGFGAAVMWDGAGTMTDLGTLGDDWAEADDINDSGWIAGSAYVPNGQFGEGKHAFLYRNGQMEDLGFLPFGGHIESIATAINESGTIVGHQVDMEGNIPKPWIWTQTGGLQWIDLAFLGSAHDVNDQGQVLVWSREGTSSYVWTNGQFRQLVDAGNTRAINNSGWVIGLTEVGNVRSLWIGDDRYTVQNLLVPGSGYTITNVHDLNNSGQILATALFNGTSRSVLLTPVPEPASLVVLGLGGLLIARRRRKA